MTDFMKEVETMAKEDINAISKSTAKEGIYVVADIESDTEKTDVLRRFKGIARSKGFKPNAYAYAVFRNIVLTVEAKEE